MPLYTIIPDLPEGGGLFNQAVNADENYLVLEQDITRKIKPLAFLQESIPQIPETDELTGDHIIPVSQKFQLTNSLTVDNLMYYINTHLNRIEEVYFVSSLSGVDSVDFAERGKNEQLPFKTIKFAAQQISKSIAKDALYPRNPNYTPIPLEQLLNPTKDPNFVMDVTTLTPTELSSRVRKQYTIMVRSGDYVEDNPVYLPPNTSLIGDNLRRTVIRPKNVYLDLFWVDSANYIWGFTFRDHKAPAAAVAFPISTAIYNKSASSDILSQYRKPAGEDGWQPTESWVRDSYNIAYTKQLQDETFKTFSPAIDPLVVPEKRPFIYVSPYVQGCTSYAISDRMPSNLVGDNINNPLYPETWREDSNDPNSPTTTEPPPNNAGCGMRIDGSLVDGYFRSMVLDSYTQVNQGGRGIYLLNHGYAQLVSIFTIATSQGVVCEAGATCSISTSNSTFGLSGLVAFGKSYSEVLSGRFVIPESGGPSNNFTFPISTASFANGNTFGVYGYSVGSNLFTINDVQPVPVGYPGDDVTDVNPPFTVSSQPYATLCFTVGDDKPWIAGYDLTGTPYYSGPGYLMENDINPTVNRTRAEFNSLDPYSELPMYQVKLFYIEQGTPTPSLSGGRIDKSQPVYDIYNYYKLSQPSTTQINQFKPNLGLPWDINLSFNLSLDLKRHLPIYAPYDQTTGQPQHFNIDFNGRPVPINYSYYDNGSLVPVASGTSGALLQYWSTTRNGYNLTSGPAPILRPNGTLFPQGTIDFTNAPVKFYARSVIETGGHTFEYMGTGTRMKYAIPAFGGLTNNVDETAADGFNDAFGNAPGTVFFTSSNELGNFKVGRDFTIVQSTGTIQGDTFSRAILTLVTPLTIALE
jgi:hypothetical protein